MSGGKWRPAGRGGPCRASRAVLKAPAVMGQDLAHKEDLAAEVTGRGPRARSRQLRRLMHNPDRWQPGTSSSRSAERPGLWVNLERRWGRTCKWTQHGK